ncbi:hypothetical protein DCAR_0416674 [Daucus carota subsp. sativus]|uniref:AB hydrolase-1 domain-containing protein n=1 Tax=Daucus carota subsp. sativus TaxID=79200 RepID=A0AAF1AWA5_DAUCS|nr:PREDICTED: phospholipase ABHD3-like [Daucus carota subsp. sativus]WOG97334.1 hypothetical protein DCAR_0416674 [Daucus carota subsp. sativus]
MDVCAASIEVSPFNGYKLLFKAIGMIPVSHYVLGSLCILIVFLYNFLEFHFLEDFLYGGSPVKLTYHSGSELYQAVVSKCRLLHGRYSSTPWLASPHLQTVLLEYIGSPPAFTYTREIFHSSEGGTFALDWLRSSDLTGSSEDTNTANLKNDSTPIVVVVPGLTSDSSAAYVKSVSYNTAKCGKNVVVCNHRGMGGVPFTSSYCYNAGKTKDVRDVVNYLVNKYPMAPVFLVGTSIGANIVGKYLGEEGANCPVAGAAVICAPWDLLIGARFLRRKLVQRVYDSVLCIGLKGYARLHESHFTKHANWEGIMQSRIIRQFDTHATCAVDNIETADTYYRWSSCASNVKDISIPLLCISSLDDPVCTAEAIPWDECRANKNVVLATTKHGGHLGYFEGVTASSLWWVRAVNEFLVVLQSSPLMQNPKAQQEQYPPQKTQVNQGSNVSVTNRMMAMNLVQEPSKARTTQHGKMQELVLVSEQLQFPGQN